MGVLCGGDLWNRTSDRCSRYFPCLSDPARRSALSLKVTLVVLHLVFAGVLFLLDGDLIEKSKQEPWYTAAYVILFVATLVLYFVTSATPPGYVLDAQKAIDENDALARRIFPVSKQPASSKNGSVVITVDGRNSPRGIASAWTKLVMDMYPQGTSFRCLTCSYCNIVQPPRAKHCHDCDKCVLQFDHHCVWLGNCIGQGNHCFFWWYIFVETTLCLWTSIMYIDYLKYNMSKTWWAYIIIILLLVALLISLVFLLLLFLFHSYLVLTNQTTYELVRRKRIAYLRAIPERVYPFNKGICRNLKQFCCTGSCSPYRLDPMPTAEEIEAKSQPYTCIDVLSCRCC
ncbi:protein S-acyltransferase 10 [Andrographis paniculata]|uniref:protein S-acyltransferase 10 n=1 Tax=Andrographis paniculata TaxID=175694 RepID=UPI0021E735F5|nr:protein S-acyltransferase 10 [Andrographis paniculata]